MTEMSHDENVLARDDWNAWARKKQLGLNSTETTCMMTLKQRSFTVLLAGRPVRSKLAWPEVWKAIGEVQSGL